MEKDVSAAVILGSIVITNIAAILGTYVSMKVQQAKLEVKVDRLLRDVDALWNKFRNK